MGTGDDDAGHRFRRRRTPVRCCDGFGGDPADDEWYHEDERGWIRQYEAWHGDGVYVVNEENAFEPMPWHYAVNEGYGLGISVQGGIGAGSAAPIRSSTRTPGSCASPATRWASSTSSVGRARTFLGVDPNVCPGLFDEVAQVPAFTVTPEMALTHLRLVRGHRLGATT